MAVPLEAYLTSPTPTIEWDATLPTTPRAIARLSSAKRACAIARARVVALRASHTARAIALDLGGDAHHRAYAAWTCHLARLMRAAGASVTSLDTVPQLLLTADATCVDARKHPPRAVAWEVVRVGMCVNARASPSTAAATTARS